MGERGDVGRADSIVSGSERGGTSVASRVDGQEVPPHIVRLGCATFVTLKFILNQYLRFVRIMPITPPAKHRAGPDGLTTMPFWLGLYLPRTIGLSLTMIIRTTGHLAPVAVGTAGLPVGSILGLPAPVLHWRVLRSDHCHSASDGSTSNRGDSSRHRTWRS